MSMKSTHMSVEMASSVRRKKKKKKNKKGKKKKHASSDCRNVHTTSHLGFTQFSFKYPSTPFRSQYAIGDSVDSISGGSNYENLRIVIIAFFVIAAYVGVGVIFYSYVFEEWSIEDSVYFSITTLTTVGYGDLDPSTAEGKLFTIFFAFLGIGIIALALGVVGSFIIGQQETALRIARKRLMWQAEKRIRNRRKQFQSISPREKHLNPETSNSSVCCDLIKSILLIILVLLIGAAVEGYLEEWSAIDALYYATITATTIGYGDYTPKKEKSRWFSVVYIPFAVITISNALSSIANIIIRRKIKSTNSNILTNIMRSELSGIPNDNQGCISELMFFKHMLLAVGKVDVRTLDFIHKEFHKYDPVGRGFVDLRQHKSDSAEFFSSIQSGTGSTIDETSPLSETENSLMGTPIFGPASTDSPFIDSPFITPIYSPRQIRQTSFPSPFSLTRKV